jgi:hypothetical protein
VSTLKDVISNNDTAQRGEICLLLKSLALLVLVDQDEDEDQENRR